MKQFYYITYSIDFDSISSGKQTMQFNYEEQYEDEKEIKNYLSETFKEGYNLKIISIEKLGNRKYFILEAQNITQLSKLVNEQMQKGYIPQGGISSILIEGQGVTYHQAMYLSLPTPKTL